VSPRADALRNRARILQAAAEVFGEHGSGASTEDVAARADLGHATVFRHFPTKQSLLEAIALERLHVLREDARAIAATDDPGAFFTLFARFVDEAASKRFLADAFTDAGEDFRSANHVIVDELFAIYEELIDRGRKASLIRDDVDLQDVRALLAAAHGALAVVGADIARRAKLTDTLLRGVRA
jgi:AcrR family transcriptional regulator